MVARSGVGADAWPVLHRQVEHLAEPHDRLVADVRDSSIGGPDVVDGGMSGTDVMDGSISGADVGDGSISGADVGEKTLGDADRGTIW
jgi:hypothetical protein